VVFILKAASKAGRISIKSATDNSDESAANMPASSVSVPLPEIKKVESIATGAAIMPAEIASIKNLSLVRRFLSRKRIMKVPEIMPVRSVAAHSATITPLKIVM